ncbi:RNA polymerase I-specific transcription initiation factor Rrn11p [Monosporozyma servazzii]
MFELPLKSSTYVNKPRMKERQLRYRYINENSKQYTKYERRHNHDHLKGLKRRNGGYMTPPETSHGEDDTNSDSEEESDAKAYKREQSRRKNKKKNVKWTLLYRQDTQELEEGDNAFGATIPDEGVISSGNESDSENVDNNKELQDEDGNFISGKDERNFFTTHHKPQQTYEIWFDPTTKSRTPLNKKVLRFKDWSRVQKKTRSHMKEPLAQASHSLRASQKLIPHGLYLYDEESSLTFHSKPTMQDKHMETMITLLRLHISQSNWAMSYRIFALLIRLPRIDIKSIWQYGVVILNQNEQPLQCLQFLEWMHSVFSSRKSFRLSTVLQTDPVFRGASRNHTAQFSLTWLWNSLIYSSTKIDNEEEQDEKLEQLIEKLNEMILTPPFMEDGEIWFLLAMCHMSRADHMSIRYLKQRESQGSHMREIVYNKVTEDISQVIKYLKESKARQFGDFLFPEDYIMRNLSQIEMRIQEEEEEEEEEDDDEETEESSEEDKPREFPLPTATEEEQYKKLQPQEPGYEHTEFPQSHDISSSSFQVQEENSFLQALDMPDYLNEDELPQMSINYHTNRDSDDMEYSSD